MLGEEENIELTSITLLWLAINIKPETGSLEDLAKELRLEVRLIGENISTLDLGACLLNKKIYPDTDKVKMSKALKACGFKDSEINPALKILYPSIMNIDAILPWQYTGIYLSSEEKAIIEYQSGRWTVSPTAVNCNAGGSYKKADKPGYILVGAPEGALLGLICTKSSLRIGSLCSSPFLVGCLGKTPKAFEGHLFLCANTCRYRLNFGGTTGSINVKITVKLY